MKNYLCFIAIVVTAIVFLISVFLLTRKKAAAGDDVNVYGVDKKTKKDKYYVKIYIRLIIISFVSVVISALLFLISGYMDAKKKYDAFNDKKFLEALDGNALDCTLSEFVDDNAYNFVRLNSRYEIEYIDYSDDEPYFIDFQKMTYIKKRRFVKDASEDLAKRLSKFKEEIKSKEVKDYYDDNITLYTFEKFGRRYDEYGKTPNADEFFFARYLQELQTEGIIDYDLFDFEHYLSVTVLVEFLLQYCLIPFGFALLFIVYMFPTKIARQKFHEQTAAIAWINGVLGWTIVGWVAMLIWANSSGKGNEAVKADAADRFRQLEELKLKGIITEKEYEEQKSKILQEL